MLRLCFQSNYSFRNTFNVDLWPNHNNNKSFLIFICLQKSSASGLRWRHKITRSHQYCGGHEEKAVSHVATYFLDFFCSSIFVRAVGVTSSSRPSIICHHFRASYCWTSRAGMWLSAVLNLGYVFDHASEMKTNLAAKAWDQLLLTACRAWVPGAQHVPQP